MDRQQQFVLRTLEERDIRFVRLWFTDVLGYLKSVAVAPAELEGAFSEGIGFDGSAIEGFARVFESDMVARPDPSTFQVLPWESDGGKVYSARMFCDITMPDGSPSWADPRHVLRRAMGEAAAMGFTCYVHPEIEFFLLRDLPDDGSVPEPADRGGFFDQASHDAAPALPPPGDRDPGGDGHLGRVLAPRGRARPAGDRPALRRRAHHGRQHHVLPLRGQGGRADAGRARHVHAEAVRRSARIGDAHRTSRCSTGRTTRSTTRTTSTSCPPPGSTFLAGVLQHAPELTAVSCQWVNSYKRLVVGDEAPTTASWGTANRSALVRVPNYSPGKSSSQRLEFRLPDSACNPYLMYTVVIAAGLRGIREEYELPAPAEDNVWSLSEVERRAMGYQRLPTSLESALAVMEGSELVAEALGEHVFDFFLRNKRDEWEATAVRSRRWSSSGTCRCSRQSRGRRTRGPSSCRARDRRRTAASRTCRRCSAARTRRARRCAPARPPTPGARPPAARASGRPARAAVAAAAPGARAAGGAPRG